MKLTAVRLLFPAMLLIAAAFSGCKSGKTVTAADYEAKTSPAKQSANPATLGGTLADAIVSLARQWIGTPYRYGGNDRNGTDCSGLVMAVYRDAANINLPRSTYQQRDFCHKIEMVSAQPGDLLFFTPQRKRSGKVSHVGLYIGGNQMIHSSSSRGVIISNVDEGYWKETFHSVGRVMASGRGQMAESQPAVKNAQPSDSLYTDLLLN